MIKFIEKPQLSSQLLTQLLCQFFIPRFSQQGKHIFLVCLHARLVKGIHIQQIPGQPAGKLEEVNQLAQRVGIARAFVAKPKVIFADEPTGNLDSMTSRQVLYSMLEMAKSYGITFVMVTHEKELAYCGDRIVTIKDGRVLDNVLLGEDEKAENRRRLFGDVTSGDIAEPETTVEEEKKPAAKQAKAVAAAVAEKVNQESM